MKDLKKYLSELLFNERFFLPMILLLTIFFALAVFYNFFIYLALILIAFMCIFFDFERMLCIFMLSMSFQMSFINSTFGIMLCIILGFACLKFLIRVYLGKQSINRRLWQLFLLFVFYLLLPVHKIELKPLIYFVAILFFVFFIIQQKPNLTIGKIIFYTSLGLIISGVLSLFPAISNQIGLTYKKFGTVLVKGFTPNPNNFAVLSSLTISIVVFFTTKKYGFLWYFILIPLMCLAYMTVSRGYFICICLIILYFLITTIVKRNKKFAINLVAILSIFAIIIVSFGAQTKAYSRYFSQYTSANTATTTIIETQTQTQNNDLWIDGTKLDPGRIGLWKRYLKDVASSPEKLLFGVGVTSKELGMSPHSVYIHFLWNHGIVGVGLFAFIMLEIFLKLFNKFKAHEANCNLLTLLFIFCIESIYFSNIFLFAFVLLIASAGGKFDDIYDDKKKFITHKVT